MDPISIVSLFCNICQLCEYGSAALAKAKEVYNSHTGRTVEHEKLQTSLTSLDELGGRIQASIGSSYTDDEEALKNLLTETRGVAGDILFMLERIRGKNRKKLLGAVLAIVKETWHKGEIEKLQIKLRHAQEKVQLHLIVVFKSEMTERLVALVKSERLNAAQLASLGESIRKLREEVHFFHLDPECSSQLLRILNLSTTEMDRKYQDYILRGISLPLMNRRYDQVEPAHGSTFKWILESDSNEGKDNLGRQYRHVAGLYSWLSEGEGVFQIIAKPGAGKSTIMKVICDSPKTRELLCTWASGKRMIMAKFFFWKQDDAVQKSFDGLIRSLLHQILHEAPEIIAEVLPDQWKKLEATPWHSQLVPEILNTDLRSAFTRLFSDKHSKIFETSKVCIVLDGLDEFESTKGTEELISFIQHLAGLSGNIKICVSNRVMNSLAPIFEAYPKLRVFLHDLTRLDIESLVRDKLDCHQSFKGMRLKDDKSCERLISEIVEKAEGVFLWVVLILRELRQALTDGDTLPILWKTLEDCPEDLNEFLRNIVNTIPVKRQRIAYRTFAMVTMLSRCNENMRLLNYSFLEEYDSDSEFAKALPLGNPLSSDEINARLRLTRTRLTAHCKELLYVDDKPHGLHAPIVSFIHKSVREVFEQEQVKNDMVVHLKDFDVLDAIMQTHLAGVKQEPCDANGLDFENDPTDANALLAAIHGVLFLIKRCQPRCTTATCESLDRLAIALLHWQGIEAEPCPGFEYAKPENDKYYRECIPVKVQMRFRVACLVQLAAHLGLFAYLQWTVDKLTDFAKNKKIVSELLKWSSSTHYFPSRMSTEGYFWLESLFQRGLSANCPQYSAAEIDHIPIWYDILKEFIAVNNGDVARNKDSWYMFETFVRYGADCSMTLIALERDAKFRANFDGRIVRWAGRTIAIPRFNQFMKELLDKSSIGLVRLQDIVEYYAPGNADVLKELIIRNQAREEESPSIVTLSNRDFEEAWSAAAEAGEDVEQVIFRMREPNWDVSLPTAAELEAKRFKKWSTDWDTSLPSTAESSTIDVEQWAPSSSSAPDSSIPQHDDGSASTPGQASIAALMVGYTGLSLPLALLLLSAHLVLSLPQIWKNLVDLDSSLPEL